MNFLKNAPLRHKQLALITLATCLGDREVCIAAGMNDYISKPVDARELQNALERAAGSIARQGTMGKCLNK